jgi:hypothetical protein
MTVEERKSIDNAIWLCANCSIDIDRDIEFYTVSFLKSWRKTATDKARNELGRRLHSEKDTIDTVSAALTGFSKDYLTNAIANVHAATEKSLETLDPRFSVHSSRKNSKTTIRLNAKEEIDCALSVPVAGNELLNDQYQSYVDHGNDVVIDTQGMQLTGSRLLETLFSSKKGRVKFSGRKLKAHQKLWLVQKGTGKFEHFDDIQGYLQYGSKTFTFHGDACDGILGFNYHQAHNINIGELNKAEMTFSLNYDKWKNSKLATLHYIEKLSSFYSKVSDGWEFFTSLEVNGDTVFSSNGYDFSDKDFIKENAEVLSYLLAAKVICKTFGFNVQFDKNGSYTPKGYKQILDIAEILNNNTGFREQSLSAQITFKVELQSDVNDPKAFKDETKPHNLEFPIDEREVINLFGHTLSLPKRAISIKNTGLKLITAKPALVAKSSIEFECVPLKGFHYKVTYLP